MSTLAELKDWVTKMLELEGKATPGDWLNIADQHHSKNQRVESADLVSTEHPDMRVSTLYITAWKQGRRDARPDAALMVASRNSFRPLLTTTLEQIAAVEGCRNCKGSGMIFDTTTATHFGGPHYGQPCSTCSPNRASLERLAQQVLEGKWKS